uniref:Uncharacterized protein n=1 Tax=Oryza rufipogon TaxID=4529 RepID=A0A0E0N9H7_ORYRU
MSSLDLGSSLVTLSPNGKNDDVICRCSTFCLVSAERQEQQWRQQQARRPAPCAPCCLTLARPTGHSSGWVAAKLGCGGGAREA